MRTIDNYTNVFQREESKKKGMAYEILMKSKLYIRPRN